MSSCLHLLVDFCTSHIHRHGRSATAIAGRMTLPCTATRNLPSSPLHAVPSSAGSAVVVIVADNRRGAQQVVVFVAHFHFRQPVSQSVSQPGSQPPRRANHHPKSPFSPIPLSHFITCTLIRPHSTLCRSVGGWVVLSVGLPPTPPPPLSQLIYTRFFLTRTHIE